MLNIERVSIGHVDSQRHERASPDQFGELFRSHNTAQGYMEMSRHTGTTPAVYQPGDRAATHVTPRLAAGPRFCGSRAQRFSEQDLTRRS